MNLPRLFFSGLCLTGLVAGSARARASETFPPLLKANLELSQLPYPPKGCQLCHQTDDGGAMTATKPFGRAMLKAGTVGGSPPSMIAALHALEADGTDSDGDGTPDIAELRAGSDPNVPAEGAMVVTKEIPLPETGCSMTRVDGAAGTWSLWVVIGFAWLRKKQRGQLAALTRPTLSR
ncbi:MAG TPA: thrombospondin type 3 repeat-containing protein [Polyangiaceae bacterium]|nr:thrombospondin type 3 repeat-containing protein [Polyangiaceae bacterium]